MGVTPAVVRTGSDNGDARGNRILPFGRIVRIGTNESKSFNLNYLRFAIENDSGADGSTIWLLAIPRELPGRRVSKLS
jgi:hypothetical protein